MADRYLITGGGSVNWNSTGSWSATSGGATGASFPVAGDNVFMDAASGAGTLTVNVSSACADINMSGFTGTLAGSSALAVSGSWTFGSGMTRTYTGTVTFNATTTGKTITSNGIAFGGNLSFNGVGGAWAQADALSAAIITITNGSFNDNGYSLTATVISSDNANVRSITKSGTWNITSGGVTIWSFQNSTNLTFTDTGTTNLTYSGSATTSFIGGATGITHNNINVTSGTYALSLGSVSSFNINNLVFTGFSGSITWNTLNILNDLTMSPTMTVVASGGTLQFNGSTTQTLISNGVQFTRPINISSTTFELADAFSSSTSVTLLSGIFNDNGFTATFGSFVSSNTNSRTINASGDWFFPLSGTSWNTTTTTNLTLNHTGSLNFTYAGSVATTLISGTIASGKFNDINISAGTNTFTLNVTNSIVRSVDWTGFTGTWASNSLNFIEGNLTLGAGMTVTASSALNKFTGTGVQVLTTNGVTIDRNITCNVSGTLELSDALNIASKILNNTSGTFDDNGYSIIAGFFTSSNTNVRTINKSGYWTLNGTSGAIWDTPTTTNLTFNDTGTLDFAGTGIVVGANFNTGGLTFNNVKFSGTGNLGFSTASPTIASFDWGTGAKTVSFAGGQTYTFGAFVYGDSNLKTINARSSLTPFNLVYSGSGVLDMDHFDVSYVTGKNGYKWFFGENSVNSGNNKGVAFATPKGAAQGFIH